MRGFEQIHANPHAVLGRLRALDAREHRRPPRRQLSPPARVVTAAALVPGAGPGTCGTWAKLRQRIDTKEAWINVDPRGSHWTYWTFRERPGTGGNNA